MFLKQEQDSVKFILEEEGPGIEDDVKSRIFEDVYKRHLYHLCRCRVDHQMVLVRRVFLIPIQSGRTDKFSFPAFVGQYGTDVIGPVSYTHLDVYKRQVIFRAYIC